MGTKENGSDSIASVIKDADFWSDLQVLILVVSFIFFFNNLLANQRLSVLFQLNLKKSAFTFWKFQKLVYCNQFNHFLLIRVSI